MERVTKNKRGGPGMEKKTEGKEARGKKRDQKGKQGEGMKEKWKMEQQIDKEIYQKLADEGKPK